MLVDLTMVVSIIFSHVLHDSLMQGRLPLLVDGFGKVEWVSLAGWVVIYTEDAGCAIIGGIPVKFGIAHGTSRLEVGPP